MCYCKVRGAGTGINSLLYYRLYGTVGRVVACRSENLKSLLYSTHNSSATLIQGGTANAVGSEEAN
jgi:hypothetical protein